MNVSGFSQSGIPTPLLGGRYRIVDQLGAGGFGQTFLAEDFHLPGKPTCVIKRLKPQFTDDASLQTAKRLFDTEANVLYQLGHHDQIPRLLAHFEHDQEFYLAQELVVGEPLNQAFSAQQFWTEAQVVALLRDILGVLAFVHQQDVIHRDIKPANLIRRRQDNRIVLIDFGAVKQVSTQMSHPNAGGTQTIAIGTQGYMPSEQLAGSPRFSSDVYAVGMVGIQALTGISPRSLPEDPRTSEVQWRDRVAAISPDFAAVLDTMIRYDFRARYVTAAEALAAIEQLPIAAEAQPGLPPLLASATPNLWDETVSLNPPVQVDSTAPRPVEPLQETVTLAGSSGNSQTPTEPVLPGSRARAAVINATATGATIALQGLTKLHQATPRQLAVPAVGLATLGLLVAVWKPWNTASPPSQTPSIAASAPAAAPTTPASAPAPDPKAQATSLVAQANQLREKKQYQQAITLYKQASTLDSQSAAAYWGRCYSLNFLRQPKEAIAACDAALKLNPNYAEALWSKGYALDQQNQHQAALKLYEQAIALQPNFAEAWSNKGTALLLLDRPTEAVTAFDQATRLKPTLAEAWNNRGAALWSLQRFDEAVASVDRAIQIQADYADAISLRQQMRQRLGR